MKLTSVIGIRDTRGGIHKLRTEHGEGLGLAARELTNTIIAAGRVPAVVLVCIPGGKSQ